MNHKINEQKLLKILHIEDSPRDAEIILERLITAGFSVQLDWAVSEQEFTAFLKIGGYDLVLADYDLPMFNAPAALELTKSLCPGVPFICVSGAIGDDKAVELLKLGATDYVLKGHLDKLSLAMQRALDEANQRKESMQAEAALRENEQLYRSLFENMLNGFAYCQMHFDDDDRPWDFTYLSVNNAFEIMTGLKNVAGKKVSEVIPGIRETDPELLEIYGRVSRTGNAERFEIFVEALHMWFWISVYSPERGYFVAVFDVITERKRTEEVLRNERNLIANIMETSPVGITTVDPMGRIAFANSKAIAILGLSKDEISQTTYNAPTWHISDLDGKPFPYDRLPFNIVMSTGKSVFDVQHAIHWPDGKRILLSINGVPMIDATGQVTGMVASIEDMTQRKTAEENYQTLFREMIDGFALHEIICDEGGLPIDYRFLAVNPAFERMIGLKADQLVGRTVLDVLPKTERYWIENYGKVALTGEPALFENYAVELGKHFEVTAFQSAPNQFACIFADITERKQAEEEKAKLESQLFQAQKMEAIGTLAGGIAHDFNNILGAMIGYTELAMEEGDEQGRKKDLNEVLNACKRATELVKQILSFSRKSDVDMKPINAGYIVKEVIGLLRSTIPSTIDINFNISSAPMIVLANSTQIHQVIMNLCTNATHAMKRTGGKLKIELAGIELAQDDLPQHYDLKPGPYVKLTVSDTGRGIDPDNIKRIFDPFFTTKTKDEGTGLGLSVVYGIVKSHGGAITVYSEPDKGAVFNVYLPRIIYTETTEADNDKPVTGGTERILFVDDEPALVDLGTHILSLLGYEVTGITSSVEALDLFSKAPQSFDLVITDMTLPKMTGIVLSRKILKIRPDIPIIICSGIRESDTEESVKSLGIKAYITKPLTKKELALVVRETLDGKGNG